MTAIHILIRSKRNNYGKTEVLLLMAFNASARISSEGLNKRHILHVVNSFTGLSYNVCIHV